MPRIEIFNLPHAPQTQIEGAGSIVPPRIRTAIGAGDSGNNGNIPPGIRGAFGNGEWKEIPTDEELDRALFIAIGQRAELEWRDPTVEPWLLRDMDRSGVFELATKGAVEPVSERIVKQFVKEAKQAGLIRRRKFDLKQSIGDALTSVNPFKKR